MYINWSGGLHHAKQSKSDGFWYINDIVLGIIELQKYHNRVLYIDIDVHHGDGVEEAFYNTNRVMTLSIHRYGDYYFPETGSIDQKGEGSGTNYAVNLPLGEGIEDEMYVNMFKTVADYARQHFRPSAVVIQWGADSLAWDKLGEFNLTIQGHGDCLKYVKNWGLPTLVTGGGGYTINNVARCWAYETAIWLDQDESIDRELPRTTDHEIYGQDNNLFFPKDEALTNKNSLGDINDIVSEWLQTIKDQEIAPNIQFMELQDSIHSIEDIENNCMINNAKYDDASQEDYDMQVENDETE